MDHQADTRAAASRPLASGTRRRLLAGAVLAATALFGATAPALAQGTFPNRPIRMVVPFPPGESLDVVGRVIAERWGAILGQNIVVENRPGAGGMIGTDAVAKATPDGYTVLLSNIGALGILPAISKNVPYDVLRDFAPISQTANVPFFMFVSGQTPFRDLASVLDYAKKNPGKLNFASTGIGSGVHLAGELFKKEAGIDITHVPYKGVSQALPELISGNVQMVFYPPTFVQQVREGRLRALFIMADKRSAQLPDVPTAAEVGHPNLTAGSWHAVVAPAGTPPEIQRRLSQTLVQALADPAVRQRMAAVGADPVGNTPEQLGQFLRKEIETWRATAAAANVKLD